MISLHAKLSFRTWHVIRYGDPAVPQKPVLLPGWELQFPCQIGVLRANGRYKSPARRRASGPKASTKHTEERASVLLWGEKRPRSIVGDGAFGASVCVSAGRRHAVAAGAGSGDPRTAGRRPTHSGNETCAQPEGDPRTAVMARWRSGNGRCGLSTWIHGGTCGAARMV